MGVLKKANTGMAAFIPRAFQPLPVDIHRRAMRPELEKTQIVLPESINFVRDDVITKKCQRRLFAFVPVDPALEFGAVSGPDSEQRVLAFFILRQASDSLEPDPLRLAFARGSAVVRNSSIQMPDQFIRGHLDPKSIDHTTPLVEARCKGIAIRECACFRGGPFARLGHLVHAGHLGHTRQPIHGCGS
jgi:hypothetical protein